MWDRYSENFVQSVSDGGRIVWWRRCRQFRSEISGNPCSDGESAVQNNKASVLRRPRWTNDRFSSRTNHSGVGESRQEANSDSSLPLHMDVTKLLNTFVQHKLVCLKCSSQPSSLQAQGRCVTKSSHLQHMTGGHTM